MMRKQDNFLENILWLKRHKIRYGAKYVVIKKGNTVLYCFMIFRFSTSFAIGRGFDPTGAGDTFVVVLQDLLHKVKTYHSKT
jgi:sugar/nucleoside kinase (ribokinase family)